MRFIFSGDFMRGSLVSTLCLLVFASNVAADPGRDILERMSQTYRGLANYEFEGRIQVQVQAGKSSQSNEYSIRLAADTTGRAREEFNQGDKGALAIINGKDFWRLQWPPKQYMKMETPTGASVPGHPTELPSGLASNLLGDFRTMNTTATLVSYLREQPVTIRSGSRPCFVLSVTMPVTDPTPNTKFGPRTLWIDKETKLVLIQEAEVQGVAGDSSVAWSRVETVKFDVARIDRRPADTLFVFTPPPDAQEAKNFGESRQGVDLSGQPAADFTLKGLDGVSLTLSKLRGKVVLLDFWATWCGPCRIEMPRVQKLHKEFHDKGLVVLGVNLRETPDRAREFMKKYGYTFGSLLDAKAEVAERYQVEGIPTLFVIDRKGQIAAHFVGVREEEDLRQALKKAGIE
jgi:peroxiredoxin/outer membrane lipoprotein-sorting protein